MTPSRTLLLALALTTAIAAPAFARQNPAADPGISARNVLTAVDPAIRAEVARNQYAVTGYYAVQPQSGKVVRSITFDQRADDLTRSILSR